MQIEFKIAKGVRRQIGNDLQDASTGKEKRKNMKTIMPVKWMAALALMVTFLVLANGCAYMHTQIP